MMQENMKMTKRLPPVARNKPDYLGPVMSKITCDGKCGMLRGFHHCALAVLKINSKYK